MLVLQNTGVEPFGLAELALLMQCHCLPDHR
jgi:hypothetical protein